MNNFKMLAIIAIFAAAPAMAETAAPATTTEAAAKPEGHEHGKKHHAKDHHKHGEKAEGEKHEDKHHGGHEHGKKHHDKKHPGSDETTKEMNAEPAAADKK